MKQLSIGLLICMLLGWTPGHRLPGAASPLLWQELAPGISYRRYFLPGPNLVYVARMERRAAAAVIETSLGQGRLNAGAETVRHQAERYDDTLSDWGSAPGARMQVAAAINGSYFDTQTGVSANGQVQGGWYIHRFQDRQTSSGFAWTADREAFIGTCLSHRPAKQIIRFDGAGSLPFEGINTPPSEDGVTIYTPQFDAFTPGLLEQDPQKAPLTPSVELVVHLEQPLWILPEPDGVRGVVTAVRESQGRTPIAFDQVVLSARGQAAQDLLRQIRPGQAVRISQEIRHLSANCKTERGESWTKTYSSVAGSYILLDRGTLLPQDNLGAVVRNPRTAVAFNQSYVFFVVVDGRDRLRSVGMSMVELASFLQTQLGATAAIAQDGGGSSTMVIKGEVVNHPNAELVDQVQEQPAPPSATPPGGPQLAPPPAGLERAVANGLMMVSIEPGRFSQQFAAEQAVTVNSSGPVNLRQGPGLNFGVLDALPVGSPAVIPAHPLNGVWATGYYWWQISSGDLTGWAIEPALTNR